MFNLDNIQQQKDKIAIVTGANSGLGYETTLALASKGIHVIMACRNQERGENAKREILTKTPDAKLDVLILDLSNLDSVRSFADTFKENFDKVDLLINNAGIMFVDQSQTVDGFENHMGSNYLGHFLLTSLLLDSIPDNEGSRIVTLSSLTHKYGKKKINFKNINFEGSYNKMDAYAQSKLACLMFAQELDRNLKSNNKKTRSVASHPGWSPTELQKYMNNQFFMKIFQSLFESILSQPSSEGAKPTLQGALGNDVQGGEYYGPTGLFELQGKVGLATQTNYSKDEVQAKKLWNLSEKLTEITFNFN